MKHLSTRIIAILFLLTATTIGILWFYQVVFLEEQYINRKISGIQREAAQIYEVTGPTDENELEEALEAFAYRHRLSLERISPSGELIASSYTSMGPGMMRSMGRMTSSVHGSESGVQRRTVSMGMGSTRFQTELLLVSLPQLQNDQLVETLQVIIPMESVSETVDVLKTQLVQVSLLLTVFTIIIGWLLARMVVNPIHQLTEAAQQITAGKLDIRVPIQSQDEIGRLTENFNEMAAQLNQVESLRQELIANVSHELRTPLSLIQGYAETIRDLSGEQPEKRNRHAGIIIDESQRLSRIVDDILHLSQLQAGELKLEKQPVSLCQAIMHTAEAFQLLADQHHIQLEAVCENACQVMGDPRRLEQVLVNLLSNAFQHTPKGGSVRMEGKIIQDQVRISITDTGSGIPEEELEAIWERYHRSRHHMSQSFHTGSGLGLAIVKHILEGHQARFGVTSRLGEGTTFWFDMPENP
ncbi:sensor histidine kinase [Anoxynatronum sibiricum]|uniref:histidine kinase n=1 Tax=Anoxynatronum sibiricum TaxID=210623 RepID=A0ABU9VVE2_9CLOT